MELWSLFTALRMVSRMKNFSAGQRRLTQCSVQSPDDLAGATRHPCRLSAARTGECFNTAPSRSRTAVTTNKPCTHLPLMDDSLMSESLVLAVFRSHVHLPRLKVFPQSWVVLPSIS